MKLHCLRQGKGKRRSHLKVSGRPKWADMVEQVFLNLTMRRNYLGSESEGLGEGGFCIFNRFPDDAGAS